MSLYISHTIDDVTTGSTEEVDVAATEKVKKVSSEKDLEVIATEECNSEAALQGPEVGCRLLRNLLYKKKENRRILFIVAV